MKDARKDGAFNPEGQVAVKETATCLSLSRAYFCQHSGSQERVERLHPGENGCWCKGTKSRGRPERFQNIPLAEPGRQTGREQAKSLKAKIANRV